MASPILLDLDLPAGPDFRIEERGRKVYGGLVAGTDEAGRGPLAGPVVAAAVILDPARVPDGLDDSKKLTAARREALFAEICEAATVAVAAGSVRRIDATNILAASLWAMARAVAALPHRPSLVLADGCHVPPGLCQPCEPVIKGDARSLSIAAASIVAKVTRDRLMVRLAECCPGYGFENHMGYGTKAHKEALAALGPSPHHRLSFKPCREAAEARR
ncbi:ribonuclease HII [Rhodobium gokarnense]|uniref:Ribonuclease HII n=1 Tax=Rhodobium gokarnense TaxID=364296 RepID=A0ABT3HCV8_9HYPH|nr:ribonuclease HII [Rhodobium gokarnense]MCW2308238.1 ribonuclease HII [Rhodobium gokarnense]